MVAHRAVVRGFGKMAVLGLFALGFYTAPAFAACVNPVGDHGDMLYNRDHTVMQYCNGSDWISMDASRASAAADNLGDHTATQDLDMATFKVKNAAIPTQSADVTNKAYVDAAVAAAAGSGSSGAGRYTVSCSNGQGANGIPFCIMIDTQTGNSACQFIQNAYSYGFGNATYSQWSSCAYAPDFTNLTSVAGSGGPGIYAANAFGWGSGSNGNVGDGASSNRSTPSKIDLNLSFTQIAGGYQYYACGVASGKPYCWGYNNSYQLGTGNTSTSNSPTAVNISSLGYPTVTQVATGSLYKGFLRTSSGSWYNWGSEGNPVPGMNGSTSVAAVMWRNTSGASVALPTDFVQIVTGFQANTTSYPAACALRSSGAIFCGGGYGSNSYQYSAILGHGTSTSPNANPPTVSYFDLHESRPVYGGAIYSDLAMSYGVACAVTNAGQLRCWGYDGNSYGMFGDGSTNNSYSSPVSVLTSHITPAPIFTKVYGHQGANHFCALTDAGKAYCWGYNQSGQLGTGDTSNRMRPEPVLGAYTFSQLAVGSAHTCGLTTDKTVYCWGYNGNGQLGNGNTSNRLIPEPVSGGTGYIGITAGYSNTYGWK